MKVFPRRHLLYYFVSGASLLLPCWSPPPSVRQSWCTKNVENQWKDLERAGPTLKFSTTVVLLYTGCVLQLFLFNSERRHQKKCSRLHFEWKLYAYSRPFSKVIKRPFCCCKLRLKIKVDPWNLWLTRDNYLGNYSTKTKYFQGLSKTCEVWFGCRILEVLPKLWCSWSQGDEEERRMFLEALNFNCTALLVLEFQHCYCIQGN